MSTFLYCFFANTVHAELLITPSRIAFGQQDRLKEVILVNTANETRTYALSWVHLKQLENGSYKSIDEAELPSFSTAAEFIRFSPRRVTLQPNENQRIKLNLRRSQSMKEAEYRSHLKFTVIPNELLLAQEKEQIVEGVQVKLNLFLSYSIPVIVKTKTETPKVSILDLNFENKREADNFGNIGLSINKIGDTSIIGDITVYFKAQGSDSFVPIGYNNNVSIYHERQKIRVKIPWIEPVTPSKGEIKIVYKGTKETADKFISEALLSI